MLDALWLAILVIGGTALLSLPLGRYMAHAMDPKAATAPTGWFERIGGSGARGEMGQEFEVVALMGFLRLYDLYVQQQMAASNAAAASSSSAAAASA